MISKNVIDEIFSKVKIEEVVADYTTIHKRGATWEGCCPFHSEKTASFKVSPAKGIYKCFGCGKGGNVIDFVKEHEHCSFSEAVHILGKKYSIEIPQQEMTDEERTRLQRLESIGIVLTDAQKFFAGNLAAERAQNYLRGRGISAEVLQHFGAGYAPSGMQSITDGQSLTEHARQKAFRPETMESAGLTVTYEHGEVRDKFRDRIVFPYLSVSGQVIGFTGRAIQWDKECKYPKYLNSPDTEVFRKGRVLFGLHQAKADIVREDRAFVVEGQFDCIAMYQAGLRNTIAGSGTAFTAEQARLLSRYTHTVTLVYDGDTAGLAACFKTMNILLSEGFSVDVCKLPAGEDPDSFLKAHTVDELKALELKGIDFKYKELMATAAGDFDRKADALKQVAESIALIPEQAVKTYAIDHIAKTYQADRVNLKKLVSQVKLPPVEVLKQKTMAGIEEAKELLKDTNKRAELTFDSDYFINNVYVKPIIWLNGDLTPTDIQELRLVAKEFECILRFAEISVEYTCFLYDKENNPSTVIQTLENLQKNGIKVIFTDIGDSYIEKNFIEIYLKIQAFYIETKPTSKKIFCDNAARMIALEDNSTYVLEVDKWAKMLGFKKTEFTQYLKPFLEEQKSKIRAKIETASYANIDVNLGADEIPEYVDTQFLNIFGFYPVQDKEGRKVCYRFKKEGGFEYISNFHITPLFHIYSDIDENNKRIVELNHIDRSKYPYPVFTEVPIDGFINLTAFRKIGWKQGGFYFNGTSRHMDAIVRSIATDFPKCLELTELGTFQTKDIREPVFAFSNAIFGKVDGEYKVIYTDELGIANYDGENLYSPAASKIFAGSSNSQYEQDRRISYREIPAADKIDFGEWAALMNEVYKINDNGKWAVLFGIISAHASVIFPVNNHLTSLFFIGPTSSGKSQVAVSIRSLFVHLDQQLTNLNSGSFAALSAVMERYKDVPVVLDEYNDREIDDQKFQMLKAATYDRVGRQKMKNITSKEMDFSKINAVPILLGQEAPSKDDGSLYNRCIVCAVPTKSDWKKEETEIFERLKRHERIGLCNILLEVLKLRELFEREYPRLFRECMNEMKDAIKLSHGSQEGQTRLLNTVSIVLAACKLLEQHAPHLKLPFTYREFFGIAKEKIIEMAAQISQSNRLGVFFNNLVSLLSNKNIVSGRDFKIEAVNNISVEDATGDKKIIVFEHTTKLLYLQLTNVHTAYFKYSPNQKDCLNLRTLTENLKSYPAYIGFQKGCRFKWQEVTASERGIIDNTVTNRLITKSALTSAFVVNYDELVKLTDIDLEQKTEEPTTAEEQSNSEAGAAASQPTEYVNPDIPF
ncbi:MAG: DNA primase [Prevotellaceae bacterium]|nr:DNA primase [Prevotellaceae bacterium]